MTPDDIDRVFGRGRLKMVTGEHVEVFREAVGAGERRRYTKRFLSTQEGDFGQWTEREWRILARLIGHGIGCVPDVVQFDRGAPGGAKIVQTYDAGATVDQWATILPVSRGGRVYRHVFEDCAHWWALAHHCLAALQAIHELSLVHLDVKGDNVCIPVGPADFDPDVRDARLRPLFGQLALIDFAFSLVSREALTTPLPIGWQKAYDYQSPRLLHALEAGRSGDLRPTRELDWRCDMYSVAAMLKRYLPDDDLAHGGEQVAGWSAERYHAAKGLILAIRDAHDGELLPRRPHEELLEMTRRQLAHADMVASLERGWTLARNASIATAAALPLTPLTRLAPSVRMTKPLPPVPVSLPPIIVSPRAPLLSSRVPPAAPRVVRRRTPVTSIAQSPPAAAMGAAPAAVIGAPPGAPPAWLTGLLLALIGMGFVIALGPQLGDRLPTLANDVRAKAASLGAVVDRWRQRPSTAGEKRATPSSDAIASSSSRSEVGAGHDTAGQKPAPAEGPPAAPVSSVPSTASSAPPTTSEPSTASSAPPTSSASSTSSVASRTSSARESSAAEPPGAAVSSGAAMSTTQSAPPQRAPARAASPSHKTPARTRSATGPMLAEATTKARAPHVAVTTEHLTQPGANTAARASAALHPLAQATASPRGAPTAVPPSQTTQVATLPVPPVVSPASPSQATHIAALSAPPAPAERPPAAPSASPGTIREERARDANEMPARIESNASTRTTETGAAPASAPTSSRRVESTRAQSADRPGLLTRLFGFAKRGGKSAPIEERIAQPASGEPQPSRSVQSQASRVDIAAAGERSSRAVPTRGPASPVDATPPSPTAGVPVVTAPPSSTKPSGPAEAAPAFEEASAMAGPSVASTAPDIGADSQLPPSRPASRFTHRGDYFDEQARRVLAESVPRTAAIAEPEIARVLASAAMPYHPGRQIAIVGEARRTWTSNVVTVSAVRAAPDVARQMKDEARRAYLTRRSVDDILDLQLEAFGANPYDAEVAGDLAALYLKVHPAQPQVARQLAMHAMALTSAQFLGPRVQDWITFAIASALMGREQDAINGLFVAAAIANNFGATCRAALAAAASHGDRMRAPVEALMQRIHEQGRDFESRQCVWPARWNAGSFY